MGRFRDTENKDYQTQFLVLVSILLTLIANSSSMDVRNLTRGSYATINCTYGGGEVRNLFWYHGNCSEAASILVRYFKGSVISSDETRFDLEDDNSTLILKNVSIEDEGTYCCSVDIKGGTLNPNTFLTRVNVFGLDSKTLPVIPQCQEDDHDDLNSTTCTLIAPTNLTCELHGIYPNRSVKLEWHGYEGAISFISKSYSNDDRTYTFLATTQVLQAGNFSCNASFPSEEGQVEIGVPVTVTMVTDPANQIDYVTIILSVFGAVAGAAVSIALIVFYVKRHRRRQNRSKNPQEVMPMNTESVTPNESDDRVPDVQRRGDEPVQTLVQTEEETNQGIDHNSDVSQRTTEELVTERKLLNLAKALPYQEYDTLCAELGFEFNHIKKIVVKHGNDYEAAFKEVLMDWKTKTGGDYNLLCSALIKANCEGLKKHLR